MKIAVIKTNDAQTALLARLMRAEAEGEGELGMLMVGNVGVNRVRGDCLDFGDIRTIEQMVYQRPEALKQHKRVIFISEPVNKTFV